MNWKAWMVIAVLALAIGLRWLLPAMARKISN